MRTIVLIVCAAGSVFGTKAAAQTPFGLHMGMTAAEIHSQFHATPLKEDPLSFTTTAVPSPNPEFESYTLVTSPTYGLCKVIGIGITHTSDAYGSTLRNIFGSVEEALDGKYGKPRSFDFLKSGSIWSDDNDFMMGLEEKERTLASYWGPPEGAALPAPLTSIALTAKGLSRTDGYVTLGYEFKNLDPCYAERAKLKNASL